MTTLSVSADNRKFAFRLLLLQWVVVIVISAAFALNSVQWGCSALAGGVAAWFPNALFVLYSLRYRPQGQVPRRVVLSLAIGEGIKVMITIVLLILAVGVFKAVLLPLSLTYLAVLMVQIVAPAVIDRYRN
ncbi:F0F1 ATP synthase subunit I [Serratia microhaemolytica]|uniref:F0F1 ATP synthase subunit I n=1 Tax=Serratia microhaemolytica TaxID=2675110 RepID=UPI000FDE1239|nr:F0F1 ATP synthase subunit I [Serratia microhaemolytica]